MGLPVKTNYGVALTKSKLDWLHSAMANEGQWPAKRDICAYQRTPTRLESISAVIAPGFEPRKLAKVDTVFIWRDKRIGNKFNGALRKEIKSNQAIYGVTTTEMALQLIKKKM